MPPIIGPYSWHSPDRGITPWFLAADRLFSEIDATVYSLALGIRAHQTLAVSAVAVTSLAIFTVGSTTLGGWQTFSYAPFGGLHGLFSVQMSGAQVAVDFEHTFRVGYTGVDTVAAGPSHAFYYRAIINPGSILLGTDSAWLRRASGTVGTNVRETWVGSLAPGAYSIELQARAQLATSQPSAFGLAPGMRTLLWVTETRP